MGPEGDDAPIGDVLQAVRAVALNLDRYRQALGARYGIGVAEIITLGQLLFEGPVRAGAIAERTGLTQSSVTALLDRLESRGLVTRKRHPDNRRVVRVAATPAGHELGTAIFSPFWERLREAPPDTPPPDHLAACFDHAAAFLEHATAVLRAQD